MRALIVLVFCLFASFIFAQESQHYQGTVTLPDDQLLEIAFTLTQGDDGLSGFMDVPQQGAFRIPLANIERTDDALRFVAQLPGTPEEAHPAFSFEIDGATLTGTMRQGTIEVPAQVTLGAEPVRAGRPQEPQRPLPYREEMVKVPVEIDGKVAHELAGTLTLPEVEQWGEGPYPAVVLLTGSGPQDRDEALMGHRPFFVLSDRLTRAGIAVLRYDDRGVAESGGVFAESTMEDFADDARAALAWVAKHEAIDAQRVGLLGHSEGGIVAPMVASAEAPQAPAFLVLLAGPGVPGGEVIAEQGRAMMIASGMPAEMADTSAKSSREMFALIAEGKSDDELRVALLEMLSEAQPQAPRPVLEQAVDQSIEQLRDPWLRHFLVFDPASVLTEVSVPVLAVYGELDLQVLPAQNEAPVREALANNSDSTIVVLDGLNHLFQPATTGLVDEYAQIQITMDESLLELVTDWISTRWVKKP